MQWVLVTGGARRLGAEICRALSAAGHNVVIHYNTSRTEALQLQQECPGSAIIQGDFSHALDDFIRRYCAQFPDTKAVVNNVGNYALAPPSAITNLSPLLQTNLVAPITLITALIPAIKQARGAIINLGTWGLARPWKHATPYGITKSALLFYTRSLAEELAPHVAVNMVSPAILEFSEDAPPAVPFTHSSQITAQIAYLLTEDGRTLTGQNFEIFK